MHDYETSGPLHRLTRPSEPDTPARERSNAPGISTARPSTRDAASLMHLQRVVGNAGVVQLLADEAAEDTSPVHDVVGKDGTPLDESTRSTMEGKFGQTFSDVRVHTDGAASASAESVGANAYTVGSDIVFKSGQFDTATPTGQRTLAHELTHVVQQRSGPVDGTDAPGGIRLSDPSDRFEQAAEETASRVVSRSTPESASAAPADAVAQRELEEEGASVQTVLQREELPEEEEEQA